MHRRLAAGLVLLFGCSIGPTDAGDGCNPCPKTAIAFEEVHDVDAHHVRWTIDQPYRLARGASADLDVDGPTAVIDEAQSEPPGIVSAARVDGVLHLAAVAPGKTSVGVDDTCEREAALVVDVAVPASFDVAATATVADSTLLLPPEATAAGVGLLPGGHVWLAAAPRDAAGRLLAGSLPVSWTPGQAASPAVRLDWAPDFATVEVAAGPTGTPVTVTAVPAGAAASLALAELGRDRLVDGTLEVTAGGGVVALAAFARDADGRLLRGFDDQGFAAELRGERPVAAIGEAPDPTGPVFSVVGLESGSAELRVTGHGRELVVPIVVR